MRKEKIKVAAVSYLNTKPFLFGIKKSPVINEIQLAEQLPAVIAKQLLTDEIDLGLVPVTIIPQLRDRMANPQNTPGRGATVS